MSNVLNFILYLGKLALYYFVVFFVFMGLPTVIFHITSVSTLVEVVWWSVIFIPAYIASHKVPLLHNFLYNGRQNYCGNSNCANK